MSEQDPPLDAEMDPAQEQRVRDLLAGLGSGAGDGVEPLPPEVIDRLDETLAALVAEREAAKISEEHTATGTVVPMRPRWMPRIAAAAAAVIVLGLGALTAVNLADDTGDTSAKSSDAGGSTALEATPESRAASPGTAADGKAEIAPAAAPDLRTASFAADVRSLLVAAPALRAPLRVQSQDTGSSAAPAPAAPPAACPGPKVSDGSSLTVVSLDGRPATLVVHPARQGRRVVEAWSCDGARRLASTTVAP